MKRLLAFFVVFTVILPAISQADTFTWTPLDYPGASSMLVNGIELPNIVGDYTDGSTTHGFLYDGSTWTPLDYPGATWTVAYGISDSNIVGHYLDGTVHGFFYDGNTWTSLDYPGATDTSAIGIDGSNIVGTYNDGSTNHGFLYDGSTWTSVDYPGATDTRAIGIDGSNIVGYYNDGSTNHGFLFDGSTWTPLDYPGAVWTYALGIDGSDIVGAYNDGTTTHGFLYDGATWTPLNYPGAGWTYPHGIDNRNIVGTYNDGTTYRGFQTAPSPPTTVGSHMPPPSSYGLTHQLLYVANGGASNIKVIDVGTMSMVDTITVPRQSDGLISYGFKWEVHGVVPSKDRGSVYAVGAMSGGYLAGAPYQMYEISTATDEVLREIPLAQANDNPLGYNSLEYNLNDENSNEIIATSINAPDALLMAMGLPDLGRTAQAQVGGLSFEDLTSGTNTGFMSTDFDGDLESATTGIAWDASGTRAFAPHLFEPTVAKVDWLARTSDGEIALSTGEAYRQATSAKGRGLLFVASSQYPDIGNIEVFDMNTDAMVSTIDIQDLSGSPSADPWGVEIAPGNENVLYVVARNVPDLSQSAMLVIDITDLASPALVGSVNGLNPEASGVYADADKSIYYSMTCQKNTYYRDSDGDGYGDPDNMQETCEQPADYVVNNADCNDSDPAVNPVATEICDDGKDNDCDGNVDLADDECITARIAKRVSGGTTVYYGTLQEAFDSAVAGDLLYVRGLTVNEVLNFNADSEILLRGGWNDDFSLVTGSTIVSGSLTIIGGTLVVDMIEIR